MNITDFIKSLDSVFEETDINSLTPETKFKELDEWSSMSVLAIISMADEKFGKEIEASDVRSLTTIQDLYNFLSK